MLLRALFWITVVSVLAPREPDMGFERPGAFASMLASGGERLGNPVHQPRQEREVRCDAIRAFFDVLQSDVTRNLLRVKADIEEQERERFRERIDDR
jgi:hypothetical protein